MRGSKYQVAYNLSSPRKSVARRREKREPLTRAGRKRGKKKNEGESNGTSNRCFSDPDRTVEKIETSHAIIVHAEEKRRNQIG